jgi:hypothetical protein
MEIVANMVNHELSLETLVFVPSATSGRVPLLPSVADSPVRAEGNFEINEGS